MVKYEQRLEQDLNRIREEVAAMGESVKTGVKNATQALFTGDETLANLTGLGDQAINRQMRKINRLCNVFSARHLPSAGHLRMVASVLRLVNELERIGDYAVTICRESLHMSTPPEGRIKHDLETMAGLARVMLDQAMESFLAGNVELARGAMSMADQVERELDHAFQDLVAEGDARQGATQDLLDLHTVNSMLERISDRAKNICEETLFAVSGETKPDKAFTLIFLDGDNGCLGPLAEAIANRNHPGAGRYHAAGRAPAAQTSPALVDFLKRNGMETAGLEPKGLGAIQEAMGASDIVVISLQGAVKEYGLSLPFHAFYLEWDVGAPPLNSESAEGAREALTDIHREISAQLASLMELLRGEEEA